MHLIEPWLNNSTTLQLNHQNTSFKKQTFPITLICDHISSPSNIGSLFRICDAYGVSKIVFCGKEPEFSKRMTKTSRATEKTVSYEYANDIETIVTKLKKDKIHIVSLEIAKNSQPLQQYKFGEIKEIAIVIGDENYGVSENILKLSDEIIHIEMFGHNSSMNVAQATNTLLYEITKQLYLKTNQSDI